MSAFGAKIEPIQPAPVYRLWVAIVAIVMVLLPLIYLGLIGLIAAGVYYHAVHDTWLLTARGTHGSARRWASAAYMAPIVAGAVVVAFMLKPLFARPVRDEKAKVLDPSDEPLLHSFVGAVCDAVGARRPSRIEIDCAINAGVRRDGMFMGLFGNNLVLRVGLPLVAGLTLRQFAGVLAHEFGHFSQGAGMRLSVLIMSVNAWFARVVYERDSWDQTLASWTTGRGDVSIFVGFIRLCVWLTRRILWVFMWAGHLVSMSLRRQMEYDADRYEARMVGGATFDATMLQLQVLNVASNGAVSDLQTSWQERRMPDDYPTLVLANVPQIPAKFMAEFKQNIDNGKTGWLDLYPCDKDRIAHAAAEEPGDGIFQLEGPATDVFRDFDELARAESLALYQSWLGPEISEGQLYPVADLLKQQSALREAQEAADRLFLGGRAPMTQRLSIPDQYPGAPADVAAARELLVQARADLEAARRKTRARPSASGKPWRAVLGGVRLDLYYRQFAVRCPGARPAGRDTWRGALCPGPGCGRFRADRRRLQTFCKRREQAARHCSRDPRGRRGCRSSGERTRAACGSDEALSVRDSARHARRCSSFQSVHGPTGLEPHCRRIPSAPRRNTSKRSRPRSIAPRGSLVTHFWCSNRSSATRSRIRLMSRKGSRAFPNMCCRRSPPRTMQPRFWRQAGWHSIEWLGSTLAHSAASH